MDDHGLTLREFKIGGKHPEVHHPSERSFGCWWYDISLEAPRRYGGFLPKAFLIWLEIHVVFSPGVEHLVDGWNRGTSLRSSLSNVNPRPRRFTLTFARWTPSCVAVWNWVLWRMRRQGLLGWVVYWGGGRWVGLAQSWPSIFFDTTHVLRKDGDVRRFTNVQRHLPGGFNLMPPLTSHLTSNLWLGGRS